MMSHSLPIARLSENQRHVAIKLMAKAFLDDPFITYLVPEQGKRARVLPAFMGIVVSYCFLYGEVWTTPDLTGIACWLPPNKTSPTFWGMLRTGMFTVPLRFGLAGYGRLMDVVNYTDRVHKQTVEQPHWYLWGIGVDPAHQRAGIGGNLLRPVLERADAAGQPAYLETQNSANLPFYQRHGFTVASDALSPGGLRVWGLLREAR
jgi:ribosomal protein S18 acetylase RimI-like enzyme